MSDVKRRLRKLEKQLRPEEQPGTPIIFALGKNRRGRWVAGGVRGPSPDDGPPDFATKEEAKQARLAQELADNPNQSVYAITIMPAEDEIDIAGQEAGGAAGAQNRPQTPNRPAASPEDDR